MIAEKRGVVKVLKAGQVLSVPLIDLQRSGQRLLGPRPAGHDRRPGVRHQRLRLPPLHLRERPRRYDGPKTGRLARVTVDGDTASPATSWSAWAGRSAPAATPSPRAPTASPPTAPRTPSATSPSRRTGPFRHPRRRGHFNLSTTSPCAPRTSTRSPARCCASRGPGPGSPATRSGTARRRQPLQGVGLRVAQPLPLQPAPRQRRPLPRRRGLEPWEEVGAAAGAPTSGWPCYEGTAVQPGYEPQAVVPGPLRARARAPCAPPAQTDHGSGSSAATGRRLLHRHRLSGRRTREPTSTATTARASSASSASTTATPSSPAARQASPPAPSPGDHRGRAGREPALPGHRLRRAAPHPLHRGLTHGDGDSDADADADPHPYPHPHGDARHPGGLRPAATFNAGGGAYTGADGRVWAADGGFAGAAPTPPERALPVPQTTRSTRASAGATSPGGRPCPRTLTP